MNPQLNKVFSKLAKEDNFTKLASQKVELGLIDDLDKALDQGEDIINGLKEDNQRISQMEKSINGYLKEQNKLISNEDKASDKFFDAEKKLAEAKQKFEEAKSSLESNKDAISKREQEVEKAEKSKAPKVKKAQNLLNVFDKNLQKAEAAAKDLGLKLPIAKYKKMQDNLRKNL